MEDRIGSIEPGKLADVVVVDGDLEGAPIQELSTFDSWLTLIDGRIGYARDGSAADAFPP